MSATTFSCTSVRLVSRVWCSNTAVPLATRTSSSRAMTAFSTTKFYPPPPPPPPLSHPKQQKQQHFQQYRLSFSTTATTRICSSGSSGGSGGGGRCGRALMPDIEEGDKKIIQMNQLESILELSAETRPENFLLVDVREPHEFAAGAIPTAINIPLGLVSEAFALDADDFAEAFNVNKMPTPDTPGLVLYCRSGVRSESARAQLAAQGWTHGLNYLGSWLEWSAASR
eukprot:UC1_evm1s2126